ncbi:MAG: hemolysin family protein [Bacillota bacterium]|nr:hemolysin family protein [Bacillota bacterium]
MDASPDPSTPIGLQLLFLAVLILINAYFAAAEMSIVSVNRNKIKIMAQEGNKKAETLLKLLEEPNTFLSTIQVAITLAGFLASAAAAMGMADDVGVWLAGFGIPYGTQVGVVLVTLILSYVTLVLGELFPKRVALQHSEALALSVVRSIVFFSRIAKPFVWLLSVSVTAILKLTRQKTDAGDGAFSEEEVISMLEVGQESGVLKEEGAKMINSIFDFDDKLAYEVMTPRTEVFLIDIDDPLEEYVDELMELRYTRIPVYEDDTDNIIGILNMKDYFLKARERGFENVDIREILRKPFFVPENKNIDDLFRELQSSKQHIAILIDEYGGFSGIVTMEDLIEEVMGDIDDEYDVEEEEVEQLGENVYLLDGLITLDDLNEELGLELESENSETLGGYLMDILGEIPEDGENLELVIPTEECIFTIECVSERRIERVKVEIKREEDREPEETAE